MEWQSKMPISSPTGMAKAGAPVANQARLDAMLAVFGQAAIEAAAPAMGERVLDVGCSPGGRIWLWIPRQRGALLSPHPLTQLTK